MPRIHLATFLLAALASGCGGNNTAPVSGVLTFKGEPVTAGSLIFVPKVPEEQQFQSVRTGAATPDQSGRFYVSSYASNDGAVVGTTYNVAYAPPAAPQSSDKEIYAKMLEVYNKFGHLRLPDGFTVEVKPGSNDLKLELIAGPKTAARVDSN